MSAPSGLAWPRDKAVIVAETIAAVQDRPTRGLVPAGDSG